MLLTKQNTTGVPTAQAGCLSKLSMHFAEKLASALLLQARALPPKKSTFGESRAQVVC